MPVYAKKVTSADPIFRGRSIQIYGAEETSVIPVPDDVVLCNGCNENKAEGYLIYLGKRELKADRAYDFYCEHCLKSYFPKHEVV